MFLQIRLCIWGLNGMDLSKNPFFLNEKQIQWVNDTFSRLTPEEKAGQVFCPLGNLYPQDKLVEMVNKYHIGGILFRPDTAENLNKRFEELDSLSTVPLLKAANLEEGGCGAITEGTRFASEMEIAATDDPVWAERLGKVCAAEGSICGINWTFSPVVDIDMNFRNPITNERTFGDNPELIKKMALAYIKAVQDSGMAACAKHFPGDGVDYRDHHLHPTVNSLPAKDWYETYGSIYKFLIDNGLLSIMVGHILVPNVVKDINPELNDRHILPASMSREMLHGVLREKYGFNGLIITDATIMGGYTQSMERRKAIPLTIAAGCDMILFNTDFEQDYGFLMDGIRSGLLSEERLDEAVMRILALKARLMVTDEDKSKTAREILPVREWQRECAELSVTLVKNNDDVLPLTPEKFSEIQIVSIGNDSYPGGSVKKTVERLLTERGFRVTHFNAGEAEMRGPKNHSDKCLILYLCNLETKSDQTAVRIFWQAKMALDMPRFVNEEKTVFVSFANPYHLQDVPRVRTFVNAYTANEATVEAVVRKLCGEQEFKGKSPVDPFCGMWDTRL